MLRDTFSEILSKDIGMDIYKEKVNKKLEVWCAVPGVGKNYEAQMICDITIPNDVSPMRLFDSDTEDTVFLKALEEGKTVLFEDFVITNEMLCNIVEYVTTHDDITIDDNTTTPPTSKVIKIHPDFKVILTINKLSS